MKKFILSILIIFLFVTFFYEKENTLDKYKEYFVQNQDKPKDKLTATFLGVSSILFSDGKNSILIDGFVSRPSLSNLLFTKIESNEKQVYKTIDKLGLKKLDAIIPLHSHHDHAMDAPYFAKKLDAKIIGSSSTLNIARTYQIKETNLEKIDKKTTFIFGEFEVTIIPSRHTTMSPFLGFLVGLGKSIEKPISKASYFTSYKEGGTYSAFIKHKKNRIFVNGSTNYLPNLSEYRANIVFFGIAELGEKDDLFRKNYYETVVKNLEPKRVIPIHWDDFTKSLDEPISPLPKLFDDFDKSMQFLIKKSKEDNFELELMKFFDTIILEE